MDHPTASAGASTTEIAFDTCDGWYLIFELRWRVQQLSHALVLYQEAGRHTPSERCRGRARQSLTTL